MLTTWDDAPTLAERFEVACSLLARALPTRRRLGSTYQGFAKALLRHGLGLVEQVQTHLRQQSLALCGAWRLRFGLECVAADGSRYDVPRTIDNETHLGIAGRAGTHPQIAATTLWHMGLGVPWAWRAGRADEAERTHLRDMLDEMPQGALLVADAGFTGYDLIKEIIDSGRHVLIRAGSNVTLVGDAKVRRRGGVVQLHRQDRPQPLTLRLVVVEEGRVYLLTDVDEQRLSDVDAGSLYAMRWGVEVFYRHTKQTLEHRKMRSASAARALLELHWMLIGAWMLMLLNAAGLASREIDPLRTSVAAAARVVRRCMRTDWPSVHTGPSRRNVEAHRDASSSAHAHRASASSRNAHRATSGPARALRRLMDVMARCVRDDRPRTCPKTSYRWPHKKRQPPPGPPRLRSAAHPKVPAGKALAVT